jgi:hypothetical protein
MIDPAYALSRGFADVGLGTALCLTGEADEAASIVGRTADVAVGYGSSRLAGEVVSARNAIRDLLLFPVVVGHGKRLFGGTGNQAELTLAGSQAFSSGVVHLTYHPAS